MEGTGLSGRRVSNIIDTYIRRYKQGECVQLKVTTSCEHVHVAEGRLRRQDGIDSLPQFDIFAGCLWTDIDSCRDIATLSTHPILVERLERFVPARVSTHPFVASSHRTNTRSSVSPTIARKLERNHKIVKQHA